MRFRAWRSAFEIRQVGDAIQSGWWALGFAVRGILSAWAPYVAYRRLWRSGFGVATGPPAVSATCQTLVKRTVDRCLTTERMARRFGIDGEIARPLASVCRGDRGGERAPGEFSPPASAGCDSRSL